MARNCLLSKEALFSLRELSRKVKIHRHSRTLSAWCTTGLQASNGKRVRLECVEVGGSFHSSIEAYERFIEKLMEE
jgi:hypothetical protein